MRFSYIDLLKVISCLLVINLHCTSPWVGNFLGTPLWYVGMANAIFTHTAVPMFFLLAGAVVQAVKVDLLRYYLSIFVRYVVPTFLFIVFYKLLGVILLGQRDFFSGVFYSLNLNPGFHLWFMYVYIGFMLVRPVLWSIAANDLSRKVFVYVGFFYIFVLPVLESLFHIHFPIINVSFTIYGYYFVLGYHLKCTDFRISNRILLFSIVFLYFIAYLFATLSSNHDSIYTAKYLTANSFFIVALSSLFFVYIKNNYTSQNCCIEFISKNTYLIYLYHFAFLLKPFHFISFSSITLTGLLGSIFYTTPIVFLFCLILSILTRFVLMKIRAVELLYSFIDAFIQLGIKSYSKYLLKQ